MSGGVDSSVAAALLVEQGYDVVGMSIDMFSCHALRGQSCCSARDRMDARKVCEGLGIPHISIDRKMEFKKLVIDPFVEEYLSGRTPSPCVACNRSIKFPALMEEAAHLGAGLCATGHYARVEERGGAFALQRSCDEKKDQSYFLFSLGQEELSRLLFPLGGLCKSEVRKKAAELMFDNAEKKESQEVCFAPDDGYALFVESQAAGRIGGPGEFVDAAGKRLGTHEGIHRYTVGQRRGLGKAFGRRQYVLSIDRALNRVVLGQDADLMRGEITVSGVSWTDPKNAGDRSSVVKVRSTHQGAPARIEMQGADRCRVLFDEPVRAPAPGQAAVFYDGDEVLGGGWIE